MKKLLSLSFICLVVLTGCGTTADKNKESNKETEVTKVESLQEDSKEERKEEQRIVATSVALVEILDALGTEGIVGVPTSAYKLPDNVKDAQEIGNPMSPDMEVIKSLDPTLVASLVALEPSLGASLGALNIPVEFFDLGSYDGMLNTIATLGETVAAKDQAEALIAQIRSKEIEVMEAVKDEEKPSVLIIFGASGNFQVATELSYVGDLVKKVGGQNIMENPAASFIPVDMEYLAATNPDYILLLGHANPEDTKAAFEQEFAGNPAWNNFDAVKEDRVAYLENGYFGMSANLLAPEALEKLQKILYSHE